LGRPSSDYGCALPDAGRCRTCDNGRPRDLPVPEQVVSVRARGLRPRRADMVLASARHAALPSAFLHSVGTPDVNFTRLNTLPTLSPAHASPPPSRMTTHDSGSSRLARSSTCRTPIHYHLPVSPAHGECSIPAPCPLPAGMLLT